MLEGIRRAFLDQVPHTPLVYDGDYWEEGPTFAGESVLHFKGEDLMVLPFYHSHRDQSPHIFPKDLLRPSRRWAEKRYTNLVYWNRLDRGGHFAAFEQPDLFVKELRACFGKMRAMK